MTLLSCKDHVAEHLFCTFPEDKMSLLSQNACIFKFHYSLHSPFPDCTPSNFNLQNTKKNNAYQCLSGMHEKCIEVNEQIWVHIVKLNITDHETA